MKGFSLILFQKSANSTFGSGCLVDCYYALGYELLGFLPSQPYRSKDFCGENVLKMPLNFDFLLNNLIFALDIRKNAFDEPS